MNEPLTIALNCPSCGAATEVRENSTVLACPHCGSKHLLTGITGPIRSVIPFSVGGDDVKNLVLKYFRMRITAQDMTRQGYLRGVVPLYIPIWRITEKYLGWLMERRKRPRILRRGTVFNLPACSTRGLGFSSVAISERDLKETRLFQPEEAQREAVVYDITIPSKDVLEVTRRSTRGEIQYIAPSFLKRVKRVSTSVSLVYFPFWLVKYSYRGRSYQVVIDGRHKTIVSARFPANPWARLAPMLGVSALVPLLATTILPMSRYLSEENQPGDFRLLLLLLLVAYGLPSLVFFTPVWLSNTYSLLRYGREIRIEDSRRTDLLPGSRGGWASLFSAYYDERHFDVLKRIRKKGRR